MTIACLRLLLLVRDPSGSFNKGFPPEAMAALAVAFHRSAAAEYLVRNDEWMDTMS